MKGQFNGTCEKCNEFKPRCARVHWLNKGKGRFGRPAVYAEKAIVVCDDCRRENKNRFTLAGEHR